MNKIWQHLLGAVQFSAEGGDAARLLNSCMEKELSLTAVKGTPLGFTAWIPARQYKELRKPARRSRVRVHMLRKRGLVFRFRKLRGRWGIPIGLLLFSIMVPWLQGFVWTIGYYDLSAQEANGLAAALLENSITCGSRPTSEELAAVRQKILLADEEYASLSFNFVKGRLIVEATKAEPKPAITDNATPVDIVADKDGVLYSLEVYSGYAVRSVGQSVHEGDVIISHSYTDERTGATVTGHSRAKIIAQTQTVFTYEQPLTIQKQLPTGEVQTLYTLCCGDKQLPISFREALSQPSQITTQTSAVAPLGWALPFSVKKETQVAMADTAVTLTEEQAQQRAKLVCDEMIDAALGQAEILSREYEEIKTEESIICRATVVALEEIGKTTEPSADVVIPPVVEEMQ